MAEAQPVLFPRKLWPLMEGYGQREDGTFGRVRTIPRRRYYVAHGGRGGAKSWGFARALLVQGLYDPLRILCAREIMRTIKDSVHKLLADQIGAMNLGGFYDVKEAEIVGRNGSEFMFTGLRNLDAHKIKSYEGVDRAWVEEAHTLTENSLNILRPTIRAPGSEIWFSFNPEMDTDPVYDQFVTNAPENAFVCEINWRDNPWFTQELEAERQLMLRRDPEGYQNVWEGKPRSAVVGAIYAKEVGALLQKGRFRPLPYDPRLKVHTIWDLGWNDQTTIIFVQVAISEVRIIHYAEASFLRPDQWAKYVNAQDYIYGDHWLPHDGANKLQAAGGKSMRDVLAPLLKRRPRIIKKMKSVEDGIKAARMLWPRVYMDDSKAKMDPATGITEGCGRLLECLKRFKRAIPESTGEPGQPVKDEYRHGSDAFAQLGLIVDQLNNDDTPPAPMLPAEQPRDAGVGI